MACVTFLIDARCVACNCAAGETTSFRGLTGGETEENAGGELVKGNTGGAIGDAL